MISETEAPVYEHPHIVFVGLKKIISVLDDEHTQKITLILEKGNRTYNMSILWIDNSNDMSDYVYSDWYRTHVDNSTGVWLENGITNQSLISTNSYSRDMYQEIPKTFGYIVKRGSANKMKYIGENDE